MILQSFYHIVGNNGTEIKMRNEDRNEISISVKDWHEMHSPDTVSVTIMRPLKRVGAN